MSRPLLLVLVLLLILPACTTAPEAPATDPTVGEAPATGDAAEPAVAVGPTSSADAPAETDPVLPVSPTTPPVEPPPVPGATRPPSGPPDPAAVPLALEPFADMAAPVALAVRPGEDTLWVAERGGTVRPVTTAGGVGAPVLDLSAATTTDGERGLLGLAWAADGDTLYLSYTDTDGANVLAAADVVDGVLSGEPRTVLRVPQPASNHNGGDVHVGPDGYVWWALGDGGAADDRFGNGQRPDTLLATMVRIDPEGGDPYVIPGDNPWAGGREGAPEVWAIGLRNPWRFTFDRFTGDLWVADVGQNAVEEINKVSNHEPGLNYGWPTREGDRAFDDSVALAAGGTAVEPVHVYDHSRGCSITGGVVYRGVDLDPRMSGAYLYADYCDGRIFALATDGDEVLADVDTGLRVDQPVAFGAGADGTVYVLSLTGSIMKVVQG